MLDRERLRRIAERRFPPPGNPPSFIVPSAMERCYPQVRRTGRTERTVEATNEERKVRGYVLAVGMR